MNDKAGGPESAPMDRASRHVTMAYARELLVAGAAYEAAVAASRAVCGAANSRGRHPELEMLLDAATQVGLGEVWLAEAHEQAERYNREIRQVCAGEELPTEASATRTALWAETLYNAAEAHLRELGLS